MNIQAWPFLVSRSVTIDYNTIVAPDFMCEAHVEGVLASEVRNYEKSVQAGAIASGSFRIATGEDITIAFRKIEATGEYFGLEGTHTLRDMNTRPILHREGIVLKGKQDIEFSNEVLDEAHRKVMEAYRNFWSCSDIPPVVPSEALLLTLSLPQTRPTSTKSAEPENVPEAAAQTRSTSTKSAEIDNVPAVPETPAQTRSTSAKSTEPENVPDVINALGTQIPTEWEYVKGYITATKKPANLVKFGFDGLLAVGDEREVRVYYTQNGEIKGKLHSFTSGNEEIVEKIRSFVSGGRSASIRPAVDFSPDGRFVAVAEVLEDDENVVTILDLNTEKKRELNGYGRSTTSKILSIAFTHDSQKIITGSSDGRIKIWNTQDAVEIVPTLPDYSYSIRALATSPREQKFAFGDEMGNIIFQSLLHKNNTRVIEARVGTVNALAFSPDGKWLACGSEESAINFWSTDTGPRSKLRGHEASVNSVAFHPHGSILASGSDDGTVRLWDIETSRLISTIEAHKSEVISVSFSPDGQFMISARNYGWKDNSIKVNDSIKIWKGIPL